MIFTEKQTIIVIVKINAFDNTFNDKIKKRIKFNDVRWVVVVGIWRWRGRRTNSSCEESGLPQVAASQLPTIKYFVVQPMLLEGF